MTSQANKPLLPAYLIVGEDELKRNTALRRLRTRAAEQGDVSFNLDEFNGEHASGADIVSSCNTLPFASNLRLVIVLNANKLKKNDAEAIVAYLESPLNSTVLALSTEKLAKNTRLYKACAALGSTSVVDCSPKKRHELPRFVKSMGKNHGVNLSDSGALALLDLTGGNTVLIDNELKKIALCCEDLSIVSDVEIRSLVARAAEVKPWEFVDVFSSRNLNECLRLWGIMQSKNTYALLSMCTGRIRELIAAQSLNERGEGRNIANTLGLQEWRVKNHLAWSRNFSRIELERALMRSVETERAMKSGSDPDAEFIEWVVFSLSNKYLTSSWSQYT